MAIPVLVSAIALLAVVLLAPGIRWLPLLGLAIAPGVAAASVAPLWRRNLRRTPLFIYGMVVAHLGIAISLTGMAAESAFIKQALVAARPGDIVPVGPFQVRFAAVAPVVGPNWTAIEARLEATRGGAHYTLTPQSRLFDAPPTATSESSIQTVWDGQLYVAMGEQPDPEGRWQLRLWWKPFVTLIWAGGAMVAFGGFLALVGRLWRERRGRPA
jgi:cytochrome c-type biogenesis protein CcmF